MALVTTVGQCLDSSRVELVLQNEEAGPLCSLKFGLLASPEDGLPLDNTRMFQLGQVAFRALLSALSSDEVKALGGVVFLYGAEDSDGKHDLAMCLMGPADN